MSGLREGMYLWTFDGLDIRPVAPPQSDDLEYDAYYWALDGLDLRPVVPTGRMPSRTIDGPGKLDPYADAFRWQHHREDDEIMAILSAFLAVN